MVFWFLVGVKGFGACTNILKLGNILSASVGDLMKMRVEIVVKKYIIIDFKTDTSSQGVVGGTRLTRPNWLLQRYSTYKYTRADQYFSIDVEVK